MFWGRFGLGCSPAHRALWEGHHCVVLTVLLFDLCLQHPVLDEPIAEAVCIIADTDKWTVQVASSQRRMIDNKLGKEVLVSSLVSNLLHSTLQLYKHEYIKSSFPHSSFTQVQSRCKVRVVLI